MPKATLRVRRKGTAMVPHYEAHPQVRRFHGWKHDPTAGEEFENYETKKRQMSGAFVGHDEVLELPDTVEYRRHLRDGDLWPADPETAQAAGVVFDPNFGETAPVATEAPATPGPSLMARIAMHDLSESEKA